jgi:murein L,D-transpeptidase YafK
MKQLSADAQILLATKGMRAEAPVYIRIFKEENELEVWKQKDDGRFELFKTYPICAWSGTLGPKMQQGDKQAPEGFYTIRPGQLNPMSMYHLAFNLGFPNDFDRANGHTGSALMVHGNCKSAGCYAMTDAYIEEIYSLAREAFKGGQKEFAVNAFPFRMTEDNMRRHQGSEWYTFWTSLKQGYDSFDFYRVPPKVAVCSRQYLVNASFMGAEAKPDPAGQCPPFQIVAPDITPGTMMASRPAATRWRSRAVRVRRLAAAPQEQAAFAQASAPVQTEMPAPAYARPAPAVRTASAGGATPRAIGTAAVHRVAPPANAGGSVPEQGEAPVLAAPPVLAAAAAASPAVHQDRSDTPVVQEAPAVAVAANGEQTIRRSGKGDMLPAPAATGLGYAPQAGQ